MGRIISNFPNVTAPDADFPNGRSKDNPGNNTGTPMNEFTMGDVQQFFAKIFREADIIPNGLPDGPYDVWQYWDAFNYTSKRYRNYFKITDNLTITEDHMNAIINYSGPTGKTITIAPVGFDCDFLEIVNDSANTVTISCPGPHQELVNIGTVYKLLPNASIKFVRFFNNAITDLLWFPLGSWEFTSSLILNGGWVATGGIAVTAKFTSNNIIQLSGLPSITSGAWATDTLELPDSKTWPVSTKTLGVIVNDTGTYRPGTINISTGGIITLTNGVVTGTNVRFYMDGLSYSI